MEYNPYAEHCRKTQQEIANVEAEIANRTANIDWYDKFEVDGASARLLTSRLAVANLEQQADDGNARMLAAQSEIARVKGLMPFRFNPMQWFSSERVQNRRQLKQRRVEESKLKENLLVNTNALAAERMRFASIGAELDRFRQFERLHESGVLSGNIEHVALLRRRFEQEHAKKLQIDAKLAEPLASLTGFQTRERTLALEIDQAAKLQETLDKAANGRERYRIHEHCKNLLGDGHPGKILRQRQNERDSVRRSIEKLETRLGNIARAAARVVKTVVIDGSNLCYENHREVIGLGAIEAAVKHLSANYKVVVVFDAQICSVLRMKPHDINARFKQWAQVHIVTSKRGADETILDAASEMDAFVISNDKFRDFAEKPAVRDRRVVTHSIVNRKVIIADFDINEQFTT